MATFSSDSFTDTSGTLLQNHTGETGATWTKHTTGAISSQMVITDANRARRDTENIGAFGAYTASGSPANANYEVQATVRFVTDADGTMGVIGRFSTSANTGYIAEYIQVASLAYWRLMKVVAGTYTELATYSETPAGGSDRVVKLSMDGDQISMYIDATLRGGPVTDTAISAANKAGVQGYSYCTNSTGLHIDTFSATDIAAGGASVGSGLTTGLKLERLRLVA